MMEVRIIGGRQNSIYLHIENFNFMCYTLYNCFKNTSLWKHGVFDIEKKDSQCDEYNILCH